MSTSRASTWRPTDGQIGKVDEATMRTVPSCRVVDTRSWITGRSGMIPASVIEQLDPEDRKMFVSVTKDQIKSAPGHDNEHQCADERCHHDEDRRVLPGARRSRPTADRRTGWQLAS